VIDKSEQPENVSDLSTERYKRQKQEQQHRKERWLCRYTDLEEILFKGFLIHFVRINGYNFVFKTLNANEFEHIRYHMHLDQESYYLNQIYFIAYSIFMFDGLNVLSNRTHTIPILIKYIKQFSPYTLTCLSHLLSDLNNKCIQSGRLVEAYCYEDVSRQKWLEMKLFLLNDPNITSIDGTQNLGLNTYQKVWMSLNNLEDTKITYEHEWENAKFIASAFNSKGVRSINSSDQRRKDAEQKERELIRTGGVREEDGIIRIEANTNEELMEQLEKSIRGEKDWHDNVVETYELKVKEDHIKKQESLDAILKERESIIEKEIVENPRKFYSAEEAKNSLSERIKQKYEETPSMKILREVSEGKRFVEKIK
jgi:hypothetical protein